MSEFNGKKFNFIVIYDNQQELWMLGRPIAEYLEYSNAGQALFKINQANIRKYDEFENDKMIDTRCVNHLTYSQNIISTSVFINQAGLFELMNKSIMPKAKEFQNWVNAEVLPQLMIEDNLNCSSEQQVEIFKDCVEEIVPNQLQLKEMEFNGN